MKQLPWLRLTLAAALAVSLIANFFLLGFVIRSERGAPGVYRLADSVVAAYPEGVRTEFRRVLRENRPRTLAALRDLREARRGLASSVSTSPFDEADVKRAMRDVRASTEALQVLLQELLLEALKRLNKPT